VSRFVFAAGSVGDNQDQAEGTTGKMRAFVAIGVMSSGLLLAACDGDQQPAAIVYSDVRAAMDGGNAAAFAPYKGVKVRWTGQVVEARRQFGDDYAEEGVVLVDMDAPAAEQHPEPDVTFQIPPSKVTELVAGQPVTFVGIIREPQRGPRGEKLLRMELRNLED
jgi:hypothetical protein